MILSDRDIRKAMTRGDIMISDFSESQIGPASVDLRLGSVFKVFKHYDITHIDPAAGIPDEMLHTIDVPKDSSFIIHPGEFVLGIIHERVRISDSLCVRIDGRSSWGRLGIIVHSTAGFVNPGWDGHLTLEITNISRLPVMLRPGTRICQISFELLTSPAENVKKSGKYAGESKPGASKINLES